MRTRKLIAVKKAPVKVCSVKLKVATDAAGRFKPLFIRHEAEVKKSLAFS